MITFYLSDYGTRGKLCGMAFLKLGEGNQNVLEIKKE
jgi:hypothetical protein